MSDGAVPNIHTLSRDLHHAQGKFKFRPISDFLNISLNFVSILAEATYAAYRADKLRARNDPNYVVITGDLQQVLFTPNLKNNAAFYLRKLANYNFGIHNSGDDSSVMNLWTETTAGRGSNEMSSALWNYLTTKYNTLGAGIQRELVVWTDRCIGQNNNFIILSMLTGLVRLGIFTTVNQKLFITGHSYNDCDRDFGHIETKLRSNAVMVPSDLENLIRSARTENPFSCYWMPAGKFKDFMQMSLEYRRPRSLKVTKGLWFAYESTALNRILSRDTHNSVSKESLFPILSQ